MRTDAITVVGASARYACLSLRQAGLVCAAIDLFADLETQLAGSAERVTNYPAELFQKLEQRPAARWMYTGGIENHARWIDRSRHQALLLGANAQVLHVLRNPLRWDELLADCPVQPPTMQPDFPRDATGWLAKSARSCGGLGVLAAGDPNARRLPRGYYQRQVAGDVLGVTFLAQDSHCRTLGVTQALTSDHTAWTAARPYAYAGSIGPIQVSIEESAAIAQLGVRLAQVAGLCGVFGVDLIRASDSRLFLIDVNPRLPASAELIERSTGLSIAGQHVNACLRRSPSKDASRGRAMESQSLHGKAIVYAFHDTFPTDRLRAAAATTWQQACTHWLSDTPTTNDLIERGHPIATVFAQGDHDDDVVQQLQQRAKSVRALCRRAT